MCTTTRKIAFPATVLLQSFWDDVVDGCVLLARKKMADVLVSNSFPEPERTNIRRSKASEKN